MPALLIRVFNSNWIAGVANTNVRYTFVGARLSDQEAAVQQLSAAMQQGEEAVVGGLREIFQLDEAANPQAIVTSMFGTSDGIVYGGRAIYTAVGEDTLLDVLDEAGTALALALAG